MSTYKCSKCEFTRGVKGLVTQHIKKKSVCKGAILIENIVEVKCEICNEKFNNEYLLNIHKKVCVEKKALVQIHYENPEIVANKINRLTELVRMINEKCENLMEENKELKKRVEKLEGNNEEEEEENDEENLCEHSTTIKFIPTSKEQVKTVLKENDCEDFKNVTVTLNGQRNLEINGLLTKEGIEVDGVMYYFVPEKKDKSAGDIKIIVKKFCSNSVKKGQVYCKEHNK